MSIQIGQNTLDLQALLNQANTLPDAGDADPVLTEETFTENGTYEPESGTDGFSKVTVSVEIPEPELQDKTVTANGTYEADSGFDGLNRVTVNVPVPEGYVQPSGTRTVTENGTFDVTDYAEVLVKVAASGGLPSGISALASGTVTPASNSSSSLTVNHNLGVIPNFVAWIAVDSLSDAPVASMNIYGISIRKAIRYSSSDAAETYQMAQTLGGYSSASILGGTNKTKDETTEWTAAQCTIYCNSTYKLMAGYTYRWIAGVADGIL